MLKELCSINAVSGNEKTILPYIKRKLKKYSDKIETDSFNNLIAQIDNNKEITVLLEAHTDQIGLVVTEIDENGFVRFTNSGGVDSSILPTAEVVIHGKKDIFGVIGAKPPHLSENDENNKAIKDMYIDCGYDAKTLKNLISVGDTISFVSEYKELQNDFITSKSLDNRIGVYVITECMRRLFQKDIPYNITALYSTQEEVGCRGAAYGSENINADIAIVVDVTFGISPYTNEESGFELGNGITIAVGPNLDKRLNDKLIEHCINNNIPFDKEVCGGSTGTDAWYIQVSNQGVKCILISVPIRYMHTTVETACKMDIECAINTICSALEGGIF